MLIPIVWKTLSELEQAQVLKRAVMGNDQDIQIRIKEIISAVRMNGDQAIRLLTQLYDYVDLAAFKVQEDEFERARHRVNNNTRKAIARVIAQLTVFHQRQKPFDINVETSPGIVCEKIYKPIQRVGLYIPGGSAPLVSTVMMLAVPAQIANCPIRILCTPPKLDGTIDSQILVAAEMCGIKNIYKVGGAQAIAAMAYGTESIPKVDKIFGPGNQWVTQAKMVVAQDAEGAMYDLPAGPSEVMIIADQYANPEYIAADLLSQAEHGSDSQSILLCTDEELINQVILAMQNQSRNLPRKNIVNASLKNCRLILVDSVKDAITIANQYAPEHLIIQTQFPGKYIEEIQCAGSVFLGEWSPESAGDYASGSNHVLPTYGYARTISGLSVNDFMRSITIQELTQSGLSDIAETIRELTKIEGLEAHWNAVNIRLNSGAYDEK